MIGCTRSSLNVVASEKGIVVGKLIFDDDGDTIDCTKMGERRPCMRVWRAIVYGAQDSLRAAFAYQLLLRRRR